MQCAMVALHANGYRTLTSRPGHHQTAIQTLPQTVDLAIEQTIVLDVLRKQRNLADHDGGQCPKPPCGTASPAWEQCSCT